MTGHHQGTRGYPATTGAPKKQHTPPHNTTTPQHYTTQKLSTQHTVDVTDLHTCMEDSMTSNPRRSNSTRRNKLRARVLREEDHCWLCGEAVNTRQQPGLPDSPEVDEILPVSLGGDPYDRSNVRLAHRLC